MRSFSPNRCSLPNSALNRLRYWFVHRLEIDGSLAKENQECFSIVIDFPFNCRVKSASINTLGQIFLRESRDRIEHLVVQCLKPQPPHVLKPRPSLLYETFHLLFVRKEFCLTHIPHKT